MYNIIRFAQLLPLLFPVKSIYSKFDQESQPGSSYLVWWHTNTKAFEWVEREHL